MSTLCGVACGPNAARYDFYTTHGVGVRVYGPSKFDSPTLSDIEEGLLQGLANNGFSTKKMSIALESANADIIPEAVKCPARSLNPTGMCDGWENGPSVVVADDPPDCPGASSYAHELAHWILTETFDSTGDPTHSDQRVWPLVLDLAAKASVKCAEGT